MNLKNYQNCVIDTEKLRNAVSTYCEIQKISMKEFYESIGMTSNILSNARQNKKNNTNGIDFSKYDLCEKPGIIQKTYFTLICLSAGLNQDDYICKEKKPVEKLNAISAKNLVEGNYPGANIDEIITQLEKINVIQENILNDIVMCISNLSSRVNNIITFIESMGRMQAQNMEYIKDIKDGIDKLNEKWK